MEKHVLREKAAPDWSRMAVGVALLMLTYLTVTNHVSLYPLNNLAAVDSLWPSTLVAWAQFAFFIGLMLTRRPLATVAALVFSIVWLALQVNQWYVPYLLGMGDTSWFLENGYDATLKILPAMAGRVVTPDLQHNILQLLSATIIFTAIMAVRQSRERLSVRTTEPRTYIGGAAHGQGH